MLSRTILLIGAAGAVALVVPVQARPLRLSAVPVLATDRDALDDLTTAFVTRRTVDGDETDAHVHAGGESNNNNNNDDDDDDDDNATITTTTPTGLYDSDAAAVQREDASLTELDEPLPAINSTATMNRVEIVEECEKYARIVVNGRNRIEEAIVAFAEHAGDRHDDNDDDATPTDLDEEEERRRISEAVARVLNGRSGDKLDKYFRCVERLTGGAA